MDNRKDKTSSTDWANKPSNLAVSRIFEKDNFLLFVYKKIERVVSALYLISGLFSDNEPLKWQFREVGVGIISQFLSLTTRPDSRTEVVLGINTSLLKLLSFLDISARAGFVSEMNFSILSKELEDLLETLTRKELPKGGRETSIDREFFALPQGLFFPDSHENNNHADVGVVGNALQIPETNLYTWADVGRLEDIYKRQSKGQEKDMRSGVVLSGTKQKNQFFDKGQNLSTSSAASGRKVAILNLLKDKNNLTIRDFSLVIKGCSEKTIQRELLRFVRDGVLKKSGERRWSRYSLVVS